MKYLISLCLVFIANASFATTWVKTTVDDPIKKGAKCEVKEPASYGNYIYQWPSKYDQVFWPYIDRESIWYCKKSGFVSFMQDFEKISKEESIAIKQYLEKHPLKNPAPRYLIERLIKINEMRAFSPDYRNLLTRVYARLYQQFEDYEKALDYRKQAYTEIKGFLKSDISQGKRLEYLYLASNYSRYFNEAEESDAYLAQLKDEIKAIKDKELTGYGEYLSELLEDTKFIVPGEKLDPEVPEKLEN